MGLDLADSYKLDRLLEKLDKIIELLTPPEPEPEPAPLNFEVPDGIDEIGLPKDAKLNVIGANGDAFQQGDYREVNGETVLTWVRQKGNENDL
jgi:hypothetical protein